MSAQTRAAAGPAPVGVGRQILAGVLFLVAVALIAFLGSLATMPNTEGWYAEATKAPWSPPNSVFGPVWSVLYVLIALAGWLIWRAGYRVGGPNAARRTLALYVVQLVLNGLWTPVFFAGYPLIGDIAWWIALAIILALIISVIWLAVAAVKWSQAAMWIMIPYLLWLMFATSLNLAIIVLN
ncbi:TspO/MBR family protein [Leucobacter denitrificans]|uniref:Tryptophan-rich sensory protein n=1 Tax=Leucobacter denitrificans TaxID=683042 RepID=A0A7G9S2D6_9MICO|nr:TspO/MBR family protein [Leucobacter denitrificans]QNN62011.1 tryptophan-rich sensory protein [Leucobacter denitrificans]